jgi:hypothetical protein
MEHLLLWLEESRVSAAIAGSQFVYPGILTAHGIGMAFVVGLNTAVSLRVLGVAPTLPLPAMAKFYPVMWAALWLNIITGILLTMAAASRVLVDPVFFMKMTFVGLAVVNMQLLKRELLREDEPPALRMRPDAVGTLIVPTTRSDTKIRVLAIASIVLWGGAITLGRLMAYSFYRFWQVKG